MRLLLALALLASGLVPGAAAAAPPSTYAVGSIPVAVGQGDLEFPVSGDFRGQVGTVLVSQGTFDNRNPWKLLPYFVVWAILYAFNLGLIWLLMRFGLDAYIAGLLSTPVTVLLSYFLQKSFVFRR